MDNLSISKALLNLVPGALWTLRGDDYANLEWESEGNQPTLAEIEAEIALLPAKEKAEADKVEADKAAAEAKLALLGLTIDDLKALGLN
jgi:hypothetical protein